VASTSTAVPATSSSSPSPSLSSSEPGRQETEDFGKGNLKKGQTKEEKKECTIAIFVQGHSSDLPEERQEKILTQAAEGLKRISIKSEAVVLNLPYTNRKLGRFQGNPFLFMK
jgi:hypothetical protein